MHGDVPQEHFPTPRPAGNCMTTDSLMVLLTVVLAVLTLIIAGLTLLMVFLVHKQWRVQNATEERSRERDIPRIKISAERHRMGPTFGIELAELTVANDGLVDVEIRLFAFEVGALRKDSPGISTAEIPPDAKDAGSWPCSDRDVAAAPTSTCRIVQRFLRPQAACGGVGQARRWCTCASAAVLPRFARKQTHDGPLDWLLS